MMELSLLYRVLLPCILEGEVLSIFKLTTIALKIWPFVL